jgi:4-carboxymuconolactone decarboxylase
MSEKEEGDDRAAKGIEIIRKLGIRGGAPLPEDLATITVEHLFGDVWNRPGLELEERSLVTVSALIALGRENEQRIHLRGALKLGIPLEKLEAVILHLAHYGGWPVAVGASRVLAEVVAELEEEEKEVGAK